MDLVVFTFMEYPYSEKEGDPQKNDGPHQDLTVCHGKASLTISFFRESLFNAQALHLKDFQIQLSIDLIQ